MPRAEKVVVSLTESVRLLLSGTECASCLITVLGRRYPAQKRKVLASLKTKIIIETDFVCVSCIFYKGSILSVTTFPISRAF